jgi:CPA1 family monovalent cation:H+ antiporter
MSSFDIAAMLFLFAAAVGLANDRLLGLPTVVALLIAALILAAIVSALGHLPRFAWLASASEHRLKRADLPALLLDGVLALLLFAATFHADVTGLRREARLVVVLATVGVLVASIVFAAGFWLVASLAGTPIPFGWCFLIGTILAPTDAVAVDGLIRRVALPPALRDVIAGESLFNDGAAVVVFLAALALINGQSDVVGHGRLAFALLVDCLGGAAIGAGAGLLARVALGWSRDAMVSVTVSLALALTAYRLAAGFEVSGPIAVVVAGLVLVSPGGGKAGADRWRERLGLFWSLIDNLLNSVLFLLMGAELLALDLKAFAQPAVLAAVPLALLARAVSVALPITLRPMPRRDKPRMIAALTWVGLRGPVSVALVLLAPDGPHTPTIAAATYAVVMVTIIVQGLLTPAVLGRLYGGAGGVPIEGEAPS